MGNPVLRAVSSLISTPLAFSLLAAALAAGLGSPVRAGSHPGTMAAKLSRAEADIEHGDYPAAGETARRILAQSEAPEEIRARALTVLGKVLLFNSRVRIDHGEESAEFQRSREKGLDLAEEALREAITLDNPTALDARLYLADVLFTRGRGEEGREQLAEYFKRAESGDIAPRARHLRECDEFVSAHAGVPIRNFRPGGDLTAPERISRNQPRLTEAAREAHVLGVVAVQVVIDREGEVVCVTPAKGLPLGLTEATLETLHDWRFKPARLDGEPVPVFYAVTTHFAL